MIYIDNFWTYLEYYNYKLLLFIILIKKSFFYSSCAAQQILSLYLIMPLNTIASF